MGGGCLAGTNYARVTPNGELTPCPYMPLSAGNVQETSFADLWERSDVFNSFRYPQLKGKCGDCEYTDICGGCRLSLRGSAATGWMRISGASIRRKAATRSKSPSTPEESEVAWDEASELRLSRIPYFLRAMVKRASNVMLIETASPS